MRWTTLDNILLVLGCMWAIAYVVYRIDPEGKSSRLNSINLFAHMQGKGTAAGPRIDVSSWSQYPLNQPIGTIKVVNYAIAGRRLDRWVNKWTANGWEMVGPMTTRPGTYYRHVTFRKVR